MLTSELCLPIKMVIFDIDGVMTDGSIYINEYGEFFKSFNVKDGLAIELFRCHNILTGVISGKKSPALTKRCESLGFDEVITGCKNKLPALIKILNKYNLSYEEIAFVGDDVLDVPIFEKVGLSIAPADSHCLALNNADFVSHLNGGQGVIRDFADLLIASKYDIPIQDVYKPLLDKIHQEDISTMEQ
ncbi:3-deoxy-D-manno-octulosonate 8-phosphate phosphatase KdsC [Vibrio chagasii]|nr:3-deoxy-D-manno-octulosonate 8-phosphate phosphatase KdsC [Vibrio chagasii]CAH6806374.1 3-deoxy-D-manno-octulosonate 8-phosphate phosphatase KdsC [Vibrio chagasii]CAH6904455.1 3-deoxy-D-manno-octulosonate 8-phosphate phosphatase KdsC [Vibrio chagasii]CAH6941093.1 3-deoxy-D-manno-octulosonate 8-phosphate phosphatase KdsC [Vibrio chagasii]CAH6957068.1 3-deoxy-D-manno-octulosonate 8-phosphate phosphatase KdsC [Vibrio chagasii]